MGGGSANASGEGEERLPQAGREEGLEGVLPQVLSGEGESQLGYSLGRRGGIG